MPNFSFNKLHFRKIKREKKKQRLTIRIDYKVQHKRLKGYFAFSLQTFKRCWLSFLHQDAAINGSKDISSAWKCKAQQDFFFFFMDKVCNYAFTVNTKNIYYFYFDFYFKTTPSNKCCFGEPNGRTRCHLPCRLHKQKQPHHTDNLIDTCVNHALGINTKVYEK